MIQRAIIRLLLHTLNSRFLNQSPCEYGFIGNVDAFSLSHLRAEESQRPGITVAQIIHEAEMFKACPMKPSGLTVIEGGQFRAATTWDVHELRQSLKRPHRTDAR